MREQIKFWRVPEVGNLELLHAKYITHSFSRHAHETFAIGIIEQGALEGNYQGDIQVASAGSIVVVNPGLVHTGRAANETGWTYRMLYLDVSILQQAASEAAQRQREVPYFPTPVIQDKQIAKLVLRLHTTLASLTSKLEQDSKLLWTLTQLLTRYAENRPTVKSVGRESQSVQRVRDYLEAHYTENVSLEQLATVANFSPFYLLRTFHKQVGLPPHGYLNQLRLVRAKNLLAQGWPISQVAQQTGFADQSHLTRHFKRMLGVTPGQYQKNKPPLLAK
jgi:AraC-like DNA-binding protein